MGDACQELGSPSDPFGLEGCPEGMHQAAVWQSLPVMAYAVCCWGLAAGLGLGPFLSPRLIPATHACTPGLATTPSTSTRLRSYMANSPRKRGFGDLPVIKAAVTSPPWGPLGGES